MHQNCRHLRRTEWLRDLGSCLIGHVDAIAESWCVGWKVPDTWFAVGLVARLSIGLIFAWAAIGKVRDPFAFAEGILSYELTSPAQARVVAVVLPVIELALAAAFVLGWQLWICSLVACLLLIVFSLATLRSLLSGRRFRCNCFGAGRGDLIGWEMILRNVALMGLAIAGSAASSASDPSPLALTEALWPVDWIAIVLGVVFVVFVIYFSRYTDLMLRGRLPNEG